MSLDGLRDAYSREKKNEVANCEVSRKRKLRELYNYTALLNAGRPPQWQDWAISDQPSELELRFLNQNDITKGRRFNDATLPSPFQNASLPPLLQFQSFQSPAKPMLPTFPKSSPSPVSTFPSLEEQLRAASASPSVAIQPLPSTETSIPKDASPVASPLTATLRVETPQPETQVAAPAVEETAASQAPADTILLTRAQSPGAHEVQEKEIQTKVLPDRPSVDHQNVNLPTAEDATALPDVVSTSTSVEEKPKAPHVVQLLPQEVQEARLQETEQTQEQAAEKEHKEEERLAIPNANVAAELASSPSSTVGPYSQATPYAPHHSPDTSPDTESFHDRVPPSIQNEVGSDPAVQQAKEEEDCPPKLQMQDAREQTREEGSETPDVERQIEEEQAIRLARDGKSQMTDLQPVLGTQALTELVEAREAEPEHEGSVEDKNPKVPADSLPTPTTTAPEPSLIGSESADNLPVKPQESAPLGPEHPTPPADVDAETDDAPPVAQESKAPQTPSCPERMTTRVASGAIRQKSVSEIIGEQPPLRAVLTPRSSNLSASASPARSQSRDQKGKEISTVIFAKSNRTRQSKALQLYSEDYASLQGASQDSSRDYLQGLFQYQAHHPPRAQPLQELLSSARKTVSTAGTLATIRECQDYKILKRVYQLQNANRWSLRQLQKSTEPSRPPTHLDHLLAEMKWMQTDFKEERKWKRALAATFAEWCAEYVNSCPDVRTSLRIRANVPKHNRQMSTADEDMNDAPTPDLIASGTNETESESFADDEESSEGYFSNAPAGLFSLGFNDVVMKIVRTRASDAILQELPAYEVNLEGMNDVTPISFCDPPILPVSKFVTGKLVSKVRGPPRKRSRYEYDSEDEPSSPPSRSGTSAEHSMPSTPGRRLFHRNDLQPEMTDVALFNPENKHVRDRLQAAHQFRPPTEFPMPSVSFFENRNSSQWLWDEDQKLRSLVKEYTFNWSLVAQELALPSTFVSGSGRRTPWECFERWVQLEGLPAEMSKTQYFRTYQTRLEQAQRTILAQHQAQLQQQAQQGQNMPQPPRRRTTQPIRVERRRDNRYIFIIDGMRKLARKRESVAHKQAESQKAAALRKAHEPAAPKSNVHTPQEFSRLKWEREEKMRQRVMQQQQQQQQDQQMRVIAAQRQASMSSQPGMSNGINQPPRNGTPVGNAATNIPTSLANAVSQPGHPLPNAGMQARTHPGQQSMQGNFPNGNMAGVAMGASGIPQAQMQATMQNAQRMPPPDNVRMAMQRSQFPSTNQHQFQLQQQQINMASNLTAGIAMGNSIPNTGMMASMGQTLNGNMNTSMNGMSANAGSPRMGQVNPTMQSPSRPLSSGHIPQLHQFQNQLKTQHPEWNQEQIQKAASDHLNKIIARQRAQAMNAAAGQSGMTPSPQMGSNVYLQSAGMGNSPSPSTVQNYQNQLLQQQRLMSQQQRSQQAVSPAMSSARPPSRSATPQNPQLQQSPGMQQAQLSRS
ncbi:uncharacterized protein BDR25DRAFT_255374 [Lindgomyces ingoldianus]|uniref:Uncharacterized protein n=1 Tax=Lindgomyces ingoldianus TaxID=673940 RepID=A0ACB6R6E4_9PLEO|nr:uncharacterized protein BDR25DRAFT_255374 [Lindgomyces ingoldianus]KAF2474874.1 hypothetical protein BDR25DRAFT_255374 [Lindgomyces ingoldianus]